MCIRQYVSNLHRSVHVRVMLRMRRPNPASESEFSRYALNFAVLLHLIFGMHNGFLLLCKRTIRSKQIEEVEYKMHNACIHVMEEECKPTKLIALSITSA